MSLPDLTIEELEDRIAWFEDILQNYKVLAQIKRATGTRPKGVVIPQRFYEFYHEVKSVPPPVAYDIPINKPNPTGKYEPRENGKECLVDLIIKTIRASATGLTVEEIGIILKRKNTAISLCITQHRCYFIKNTTTHRWILDDSKVLS